VEKILELLELGRGALRTKAARKTKGRARKSGVEKQPRRVT
jgi:hypothetical protein